MNRNLGMKQLRPNLGQENHEGVHRTDPNTNDETQEYHGGHLLYEGRTETLMVHSETCQHSEAVAG